MRIFEQERYFSIKKLKKLKLFFSLAYDMLQSI